VTLAGWPASSPKRTPGPTARPGWKLREADTDLAAGRIRRFEDDDDFFAQLEALDDEAGG
jgi:hypothetical protein